MSIPGTIITTGTGSGLGSAIARQLVAESGPGIKNIFTIRPTQNKESKDYQSVEKAISNSPRASDIQITHLSLDDLSDVRSFANDINARVASGNLPRIKALILNAGVIHAQELVMTKDGYEATMQVNYLANFILVLMLLPSFAGVDTTARGPSSTTTTADASNAGRIIIISSDSQDPTRRVGFPPTVWPLNAEQFKGWWHPSAEIKTTREVGTDRYAKSKMALTMLMFSLQRRLDISPFYSNLTAISVDPGWMPTAIVRSHAFMLRSITSAVLKAGPTISRWMGLKESTLKTTDTSAEYVIEAAFGEWKDSNSRPKAHFLIHGKEGQAGEMTRDEQKQEELWIETGKLLGLDDGSIKGIQMGKL